MERENNVAGDLQEATTLIEKAFMLLIKYHKRDGRPLSYQERMRLETFLGSVEGIRMLHAILYVPGAFRA
jgi:hypothetical protein